MNPFSLKVNRNKNNTKRNYEQGLVIEREVGRDNAPLCGLHKSNTLIFFSFFICNLILKETTEVIYLKMQLRILIKMVICP